MGTWLETTTRLCELVSELKAVEEQLAVIREQAEMMIAEGES